MAEYIEKAEIEKWGTCIAERNDKKELIPKIGIHLLPKADVIERFKIDKAIEEIMDIDWHKIIWKYDDVEIGFKSEVEEILKRNIGE